MSKIRGRGGEQCIECRRGDFVNSCELTAAVTAIANALACRLTNEELGLLASMLVQLGDTLVTIAAQRTVCEKCAEKNGC